MAVYSNRPADIAKAKVLLALEAAGKGKYIGKDKECVVASACKKCTACGCAPIPTRWKPLAPPHASLYCDMNSRKYCCVGCSYVDNSEYGGACAA